MNCTNCIEAKPIPVCTGELIIGTVETTEEVYVFVQNIATGYVHTETAIPSEYDSTISIDMGLPYPDFYSANIYYKLWVSETSDGNDVIPFTIDGEEYECLTLLFQKLHTDDEINHLDSVTIKV